jgi:hypothetical protein
MLLKSTQFARFKFEIDKLLQEILAFEDRLNMQGTLEVGG